MSVSSSISTNLGQDTTDQTQDKKKKTEGDMLPGFLDPIITWAQNNPVQAAIAAAGVAMLLVLLVGTR